MADTDPPLFQQFIDRLDILERIVHIKSQLRDMTQLIAHPSSERLSHEPVVLPQSLHHRLMFIERENTEIDFRQLEIGTHPDPCNRHHGPALYGSRLLRKNVANIPLNLPAYLLLASRFDPIPHLLLFL